MRQTGYWARLSLLLIACAAAWQPKSANAQISVSPDDAARMAGGEVKYAHAWRHIDELFREYLDSRNELDAVQQKAESVQDRLSVLRRKQSAIDKASYDEERLVRCEMAAARQHQRELKRTVEKPPPTTPLLKEVPPPPLPPPKATTVFGFTEGGKEENAWKVWSTTTKAKSASAKNAYQSAVAARNSIIQENKTLSDAYTQKLNSYEKEQDDAKKELVKVEAKIKKCEEKLGALTAQYGKKAVPLTASRKEAAEEYFSKDRHVCAISGRIRMMRESLQDVPQEVRLAHGILEWKGEFEPLANLERFYREIQDEIDRVREQLNREADAAGRQFNPLSVLVLQQAEMDALKSQIDMAIEAGATTPDDPPSISE